MIEACEDEAEHLSRRLHAMGLILCSMNLEPVVLVILGSNSCLILAVFTSTESCRRPS